MQLINNSTLYNLSEKRTEIMGVAMLLVIAYHFALHFGFYHSPIIVRGDIGVDIFFFLSGFGCGFSVSKHSPKDFYANRIKRIVPIYFIIGILSILGNYLFLNQHVCAIDVYRLLCISFFSHGDLSVWYIHASMLFYLLTPPIMAMINKHGFRTIYFLMPCVALAIYFCAYLHHSNINLMLYRFVSYIIGLFCAQAALDKSIVRTRKIIGGGILYLLLMLVLQIALKKQDLLIHNQLRYIIYPVLMMVMVHFCINYLPKNKYLFWIGLCSLECYLAHQPIMNYLSNIQNNILFFGCSTIAIIVSVIFFHYINKKMSFLSIINEQQKKYNNNNSK